jgi:hypothetical protein
VEALRQRALPTAQVATRVRLTKSPRRYLAGRSARRELPYEALLGSGRTRWSAGEHVWVYRASGERPALLAVDDGAEGAELPDPRDYDTTYYVRLLRTTFAARLARAFSAEDFAALFDDPRQPSLFAPPLDAIRPLLVAEPNPLLDSA